jgi:3D (Asp-Asp-Asp) domain-containing protein
MVGLIFLFLPFMQDTVTVTTYKLTPHDQGKWGTQMASGYKVNVKAPQSNRIVAVSRDLLNQYPFHTFIKIKGTGKFDGVWKVEDVMNERFTKRVDLLINLKTKHNKYDNITIEHYESKSSIKYSERRIDPIHHVRTKRSHKQLQGSSKRVKSKTHHRHIKNKTTRNTSR